MWNGCEVKATLDMSVSPNIELVLSSMSLNANPVTSRL